MKATFGVLACACISLSALQAQSAGSNDESRIIPLSVPSGAPVRLYLTKPVSKRLGAPVEGKILESVFAFDREVVPAGSAVTGKVSRIQPISKWQRFRAILDGDFTPLRNAWVEFDSLTLPTGGKLPLQTVEVMGLNSFYTEPSKKKNQKAQPQNPNGGILGTAKKTAKDQINGAINARTQGIADIVRGPNKKEKLIDFVWAKLPYHPQYMRRGMRFDAPLRDALQFGTESVKLADLAELGTQPSADSVVRARLLTALDSASAKQGQAVEAVVAAPLFSANHKLVLPEGTRLVGSVTLAKKARSFHRGGQLRFNFQNVELPGAVASLTPATSERPVQKTQAMLAGAEGGGPTPIKVDSEGGIQTQESKTRFIAPVISLLLASKAADNDAGRHNSGGASGGDANVSGRTLGGGSGFGLLGAAVSQSSPYVGMAFGYYGLAWSVYSSVVAKGGEVQFDKNAMMDIRFGSRTPVPASKFRGVATAITQ
jgi:hypothetical protein